MWNRCLQGSIGEEEWKGWWWVEESKSKSQSRRVKVEESKSESQSWRVKVKRLKMRLEVNPDSHTDGVHRWLKGKASSRWQGICPSEQWQPHVWATHYTVVRVAHSHPCRCYCNIELGSTSAHQLNIPVSNGNYMYGQLGVVASL